LREPYDGDVTPPKESEAADTDALAAGPADGSSLVQIYDLLVATDGFDAFLGDLATLARDAVSGDLSCGVTVLRDGRYVTAASSDQRANVLDEAQYDVGHGPCLHALETCEEVYVADFEESGRWPAYAMQAKAHGLRSSLSLPITVDERAAGALNLYRFDDSGIPPEQQETARRFAAEATRALVLAVRQARQLQVNADLQAAMSSRRVIDQAIGIVMAQNRCPSEEAFEVLKRASQHRNVKLRQVAADIVVSVSGRPPTTESGFRA
jgi:GAF domain-containing protein